MQVWLATALVACLAPRGEGRAPGEPPACPGPAGCDSPEAGGPQQAPCGRRGCGGRASGEPCGVYTGGCARGLRCLPRPGERAPLHALLRGKGLCLAAGAKAAAAAARRNQTEAQPGPGRVCISALGVPV
uniref:Uncharacterized protein n=1 Tax=Sphaerodactylus townsendi TaxID=933632 RepID=A0ACB8ENF2_9SAUR